jgi:hypothetical protein
MKKVLLLPLDERPCNFEFPVKIFNSPAFQVIRPEKLGDKKTPADPESIRDFLLSQAAEADAAVISVDTLLYGGLIPSRLHCLGEEEAEKRLGVLREMKEKNPALGIYGFHCIMRCPSYSSSDEEPDYYENFGEEIHLIGKYTHMKSLGLCGGEELEKLLAKVDGKALADYTGRRAFNLKWNCRSLDLVEDGTLELLVIPQDDSAPYGYTAMDQKIVREKISDKLIQNKVLMYPGADEVAMTLLSRVMNDLNGRRPGVYVRYASVKAPYLIPNYEDRSLGETIKYHLMAAGCWMTPELSQADFVLCVTAPGENMMESDLQPACNIPYDVERNLTEMLWFIDTCIQKKIPVALLDNAYVNGGEIALVRLLNQEKHLLDLIAYAGWNTSANSMGTVVAQAVCWLYWGNTKSHYDFLVERYLEDVGYCAIIRKEVTHLELPSLGMSYFDVKEKRGVVAEMVRKRLIAFQHLYLSSLGDQVKIDQVYMPWARMFEVGISAEYTGEIRGK